MNSLERMAANGRGEKIDHIPFVPTIYEHAAYLIGSTPTAIATDPGLLVKAQLAAYEIYGHDLVVVGADIYNVEAEALGCELQYYPASPDIPGLTNHILSRRRLADLALPDPERAGRMPLFLEAATRIKDAIGHLVPVNGTAVGPYTLAAILCGYEEFVILMLTESDYAEQILDFAAEVSRAFAAAFIRRGVGVSINESWIAQPVLSPELYRRFVLARHRRLVEALKKAGAPSVGIISGGDTTAICQDLISVGTSILMADYCCDQRYYKRKAAEAGIVLRGSIDSKLVRNGPAEAIAAETRRVAGICAPGGRFLMGCGVVPFDTPPAHLRAMKQALIELGAPCS